MRWRAPQYVVARSSVWSNGPPVFCWYIACGVRLNTLAVAVLKFQILGRCILAAVGIVEMTILLCPPFLELAKGLYCAAQELRRLELTRISDTWLESSLPRHSVVISHRSLSI